MTFVTLRHESLISYGLKINYFSTFIQTIFLFLVPSCIYCFPSYSVIRIPKLTVRCITYCYVLLTFKLSVDFENPYFPPQISIFFWYAEISLSQFIFIKLERAPFREKVIAILFLMWCSFCWPQNHRILQKCHSVPLVPCTLISLVQPISAVPGWFMPLLIV